MLSCSFLNSFSTGKCFDLFEVAFLFEFFNLTSKFVFFTKSAISTLVFKLARFNLAENLLLLTY